MRFLLYFLCLAETADGLEGFGGSLASRMPAEKEMGNWTFGEEVAEPGPSLDSRNGEVNVQPSWRVR